jgi:hypothetical protein
VDVEVFAEAARVVVFHGFGVAETLEERRRLQNLLGDEVGGGLVDRRQVLHHQLGALSLSGAALPRDHHHLALRVFAHAAVRARTHRKQMPRGEKIFF